MTPVSEVLLRQVPPELLEAVRIGTLKLYGSIIRDASSGQITGFLQETGAAPKLAQALRGVGALDATPVGAAMRVADLGMGAASLVQNEQIKAQLRLVTNLQLGNLLLTGVGIGVSIAGFAIVAARIAEVGTKIDKLADTLEAIARNVDALRRDRIAEHLTALRTVAERYDEGWALADAGKHWRDTAVDAHALVNQFARLATEVLDRNPADLAAADPFSEALALAISLRVNARLAAGDDTIAVTAATDGAHMLINIGDRLGVGEAALARLAESGLAPSTLGWSEALDVEARGIRLVTDAARARETATVATAMTIRSLVDRNAPGRQFLEEARDVAGDAIRFLPVPAR